MDSKLAQRLSQTAARKRGGDGAVTHVSMIYPYGAFYFTREENKEFMDEYCKSLFINAEMKEAIPMNKKFIVGMAQIPGDSSMIVVDVDIKKEGVKEAEPLYTKDDVIAFVSAYQEAINDVADPEHLESKHLIAWIQEKKPRMKSNTVCSHGFHFAFINVIMSRAVRNAYMLPIVIESLKSSLPLKNITSTPWECIDADPGESDKPWLLYGSRKEVHLEPYSITYALDENLEEIDPIEPLLNYEVYDELGDRLWLKTAADVIYQLPRILSISPDLREILRIRQRSSDEFNSILELSNIDTTIQEDDEEDVEQDDVITDANLKEASKLLDMISVERSTNYHDWIKIGWALKNITKRHSKGLEKWLAFSAICGESYNEAKCLSEWKRRKTYGCTIETLKAFARQDSPDQYAAYMETTISQHMKQALNKESVRGTHHDLAKALYAKFGSLFVCTDPGRSAIWYRYHEHCWRESKDGIHLKSKIHDFFKGRLVVERKALRKELNDNDDKEDNEVDHRSKKLVENKLKFVNDLISKVGDDQFQNQILSQCKMWFYDESFLDKLGKNPNLIGCKNGVIDITERRFRDGKPEDYILLQMPVEYHIYSDSDKWVCEGKQFMQRLFPNENIRRYSMDILSECLRGGNHRKDGYFWTGGTNNGKTVFCKFLEDMFGPYLAKIPTTLVTQKKAAAGKPLPELKYVPYGVRILVGDEVGKNEEINSAIWKMYTGSDSFFNRTLFSDGGKTQSLFKLILICNKLPPVDSEDAAVWGRARVIQFETTFSRAPPVSLDDQDKQKVYPEDTHFSTKLPKIIGPLFWMAVQNLWNIMDIEPYEPAEVMNATQKYRNDNDDIGMFLEESVADVEDGEVTVDELFFEYQQWFKDAHTGRVVITKRAFVERMKKEWIHGWDADERKFIGHRLKCNSEKRADERVIASKTMYGVVGRKK